MSAPEAPLRPHPVGQVALVAVFACVISMGLFRIPPVDVPWHLATARMMVEQGVFPVTNTFSWTWPDYPLYQQYPLFQLSLYGALEGLGWPAVSLLVCATWTGAFALWMRWGGLVAASRLPLVWLVAAVGLQRHLLARPEMFTLLGLGALLLALDRLRRGSWAAAAAVVAIQWFLVNSHQMFPLGLALQGLLLVHVLVARHLGPRLGLDDADADAPLAPIVAAIAGSVAALALSPLGLTVYLVPLKTLETVLVQGQQADTGAQAAELAPVWTDPIATAVVAILLPLSALQLWRSRGRWSLFELGLLALGVLMVGVAVRGVHFFALIAAAVITRLRAREPGPPLLPEVSPVHLAASGSAVALAAILGLSLQQGEPGYLTIQRGLGRTHGEWADHTLAFLDQNPPPGPLLNLGWVAGNPLIWGGHPVFVDPRWEAYPKPFLGRAIRAMDDPDTLQQLIDEYEPGTIVAEQRLARVQARVGELVASGDWALVHVDTLLVVLVRRQQAGAADYIAAHEVDPATVEAPDWLPEHRQLHAQQQIRMGRFFREVGEPQRAEPLLEAARQVDLPLVQAELAELD